MPSIKTILLTLTFIILPAVIGYFARVPVFPEESFSTVWPLMAAFLALVTGLIILGLGKRDKSGWGILAGAGSGIALYVLVVFAT
jgi:hypothetical protein